MKHFKDKVFREKYIVSSNFLYKKVTIQRVQFVKCQIYRMAKNYSYRLDILLITPLPAMPVYVQVVPYPQAQLYNLHIHWRTL